MKRHKFAILMALLWAPPLLAQSIATGDAIARTEPSFPSNNCPTKYQATAYQYPTNLVNLDPWNPTINHPGTLTGTGGTSFEPAVSAYPATYVAAETDDTAFQNLINSAAAGACVEITVGTSGQDAIVENRNFQPQNSSGQGVNVIIDGGVRVYMSRNVADFGGSCGTFIPSGSSSCPKWITPTASNANIYGYGFLDARGWSRLNGVTCPTGYSPCSFNTLKVLSYGLRPENSNHWPPSGTGMIPIANIAGQTYSNTQEANGPNILQYSGSSHTVLYKVTLLNSAQFNIYWGDNSVDFLGWGIKMLGAGEVSNTDGWDPSYTADPTNASLIDSFCSTGDNCASIKSNSGKSGGHTSRNISITNLQTAANTGGVTIGYESSAGVNNVLVSGHVGNGGYAVNSHEQVGHGINGAQSEGGAVSLVTYEHSCLTNYPVPFEFMGGPGQMTNIAEIDTHILNGSLSGNSGQIKLQGNNPSTLLQATLNSIIADGALTSSNQDATITVGSLGVGSSVYSKLTGTNVTASANKVPPPTTTAVPCNSSTWKPLIGEMWFSTSTQNNLQSLTVAGPANYTLNATMIPASAFPSTKESLFPNFTTGGTTGTQSNPYATVEFIDNGTPIAGCTAVQLIHGDEFASCSLAGVPAGTHHYVVEYNGGGQDPNYPGFIWGNPGTSNQLVAVVTGGAPNAAFLPSVFVTSF